MRITIYILVLLAVSLSLNGQGYQIKPISTKSNISGKDGPSSHERCSTTAGFLERLKKPGYEEYVKEMRGKTNARFALPCDASNSVVIPVAVHFDDSFTCENSACLEAAVAAQIQTLNDDFAAINADLVAYENLLATCMGGPNVASTGSCLSFCLATENHPAASGMLDGEPAITVGTYSGGLSAGFISSTPGTGAPEWPGYLNLFVIAGSMSGIADGIPGTLNGDGVTVTADVFGGAGFAPCSSGGTLNTSPVWNLGRTMTHEVGHYLGLYHVWGDVNGGGCAGDDEISDTPDQAESSVDCTSDCATLASCNAGEFVQYNFMDYFDDACLVMFSEEQANVMNTFANSVTWASGTGCSDGTETIVLACQIQADFSPADGTNISLCLDDGNTIDFTDLTINSPVAWTWTFAVSSGDLVLGSTTSTLQNPSLAVTSGSSGVVDVSLMACDASGVCSTVTHSLTISTFSGAACPNDCGYLVQILDTFGDGWDGAFLEIFADGTSLGTFTVDASYVEFVVFIEDAANVDVVYTSGNFENEHVYAIVDPFGYLVFIDGPDPGAGTSFTANCTAPSCSDGLLNADEFGVDCGGPDCPPCPVVPACASGQVEILNENFDLCEMPMGWTAIALNGGALDYPIIDFGASGVVGSEAGSPSDFFGCIAAIDDDIAGPGDPSDTRCILTPIFDVTPYTNLTLSFDWENSSIASGDGNFFVDVFDGTDWSNVFIFTEDGNANDEIVALDAYANSTMQVRFCYDDQGAWAWGAGIDNVGICGDSAIAAKIPTMGEWGLIILALLIMITSIVAIRQKETDFIVS